MYKLLELDFKVLLEPSCATAVTLMLILMMMMMMMMMAGD
jgi:hypothetical protein